MPLKKIYWCICLFVLFITTSKPFVPTFESTNSRFTNNTWMSVHMSICYHIIIKNIISVVTMLQIIKLWKIWTPWFSPQQINAQLSDFAIEFNTIKEEFMLALEPLRFCVFMHVVQPHTKHFMHIVGTIFLILWWDLLSLHCF
jgi:hypothetical protein